MQTDRHTDIDIDQHLAGSALQTKAQAQELQTRLFLVSLCTVSSADHLFIALLALSQKLVNNESF